MEENSGGENKIIGSKQQVKDLLAHMDPMIYLAGTADNTSEMLVYLADMDPSFHKLHLVKSFRTGMRDELSTAIEEQVETYLQEHKGKMHSENPIDYLVEKITADGKFVDFVRDTKSSLESSVQYITEHFDDEIVTGMFGNDDDDLTYNDSPNESNESSLNSSLNQSGLLFLHPAQYDNIAKSLLTKTDYESLHDSLNILMSVTPGEPVMQDAWPDIKKGLKECLFEPSSETFDKSLKVHCRLLTSQVHIAVKEAYLNLLDAIAGFYISKRLVSKIPLKGEKVHLKTCENIIRILKIIVEFQNDFPLIWIRYPERFVDDMVEATINLLALNPINKDAQLMTVLDMYCMVDPEASWLKRWVHGQWGRSKTFAALKSNSIVLLNSVSFCIKHLENCSHMPHSDAIGDVLNASLVAHLQFMHNVNFILAILSYLDGRKLFPVNVPTKDELVTVQGVLQMLVKAITNDTSKTIVSKISTLLCKFCSQDEMRCWIVCDAGIVETLLQGTNILEEGQKKHEVESKISPSYIQAVLLLLETIVFTHVGQRYILLGRKRKPSSKSGLSGTSNSLASEVLDLVLLLMKSKKVGSELKRLGISICCGLMTSPIGIHVCIDHPLFECFIEHLKDRSRAVSQQKLPQGEGPRTSEPLVLSVPQSLPLLTTLLLSFKGIFLLEREGVLPLALSQVLLELARKGSLTPRILAHACSSLQGCSVVGSLKVIPPFWDVLSHVVRGEDQVEQRPLLEDEREEAVKGALAPLMTLLATFQGTQLIFSENGLLEALSKALFSLSELHSEMHTIAQHLLVSSTSVLDSVAFLQASLGYQDQLLAQQMQMRDGDGDSVTIDENSILRNHILVKSYLIGGSGERLLPPCAIDDVSPSSMPPMFTHYPPPREYIPEKPIRSMHKKQNEVWKFLSDTRHGLHDIGWVNHCRKAVRSVLASGEEIKSWLVMDLIDRTVRALLTYPEELLPGSPVSQLASPVAGVNLSPPTVSTVTWNLAQVTTSPVGHENLQSLLKDTTSDSNKISDCHSAAAELVLRYGGELQLLTPNGCVRENLIDVLKYTRSNIISLSSDKCDWFTMVLFLVYGGNFDRCQSALCSLSGLLVGGVLWPALADSLTHSHEVLPGEMLHAGIIHYVELILSIEVPTLYMALQANNTCLWSVIGEWVRCIFFGVLPWVEVCHYLVLVLLQGPDYSVYFVVALVRHLQDIIIKHAGTHKSLLVLQTSVIVGWHVGDHLPFIEALSRRHRRTVLPGLTKPLYSLRHQYTPRQL